MPWNAWAVGVSPTNNISVSSVLEKALEGCLERRNAASAVYHFCWQAVIHAYQATHGLCNMSSRARTKKHEVTPKAIGVLDELQAVSVSPASGVHVSLEEFSKNGEVIWDPLHTPNTCTFTYDYLF